MIKVLFVSIPRTGSMSVKHALMPHGLHAVKYDVGKCNAVFDPERPLTTFYHAHPVALVAAKIITQAWLDDRTIFTIIRNPWDRMVSLYHYLFGVLKPRHGAIDTFEDFVVEVTQRPQWPVGPYNWCGLSQASRQVDWVDGYPCECLKFEDYSHGAWLKIQEICGVTETSPLPHLGATKRRDDYHWYYTHSLRHMVQDHYAADIDFGGYTF